MVSLFAVSLMLKVVFARQHALQLKFNFRVPILMPKLDVLHFITMHYHASLHCDT